MRNRLTASVGIAVLFVGATAFQSPADARREGGVHRAAAGHVGTVTRNFSANRNVNRNVAGNFNRNVNVNRKVDTNRNISRNVAPTADRNIKYVYRTGRRGYWRNGGWVVAPAITGATYSYVASSCAYQYSKWQATGGTYWRDLYNACSKVADEPPLQ